jgi:hypothetical protein
MGRACTNPGWIAREFMEYLDNKGITLPPETIYEMCDNAFNVFHSRFLCHMLGVDYENLTHDSRSKVYADVVTKTLGIPNRMTQHSGTESSTPTYV